MKIQGNKPGKKAISESVVQVGGITMTTLSKKDPTPIKNVKFVNK